MIPLRDDNPTHHRPYVTVVFLVTSTLVFLWQSTLPPMAQKMAVYALGTIPAVLLGDAGLPPEIALVPPIVSVFTSMFLHGGWMHLIGNMLYLWIFADNVEDVMGHTRFVIFYLLSGVAAVVAQTLANPESAIPMVGASGAISGVLGAYLLLFPHARVLVLVPLGFFIHTLRLPAAAVLGFWIVLQLINSAFSDPTAGGVAWWAHIGGFVAGLALIPFFKRKQVRLFHPRR